MVFLDHYLLNGVLFLCRSGINVVYLCDILHGVSPLPFAGLHHGKPLHPLLPARPLADSIGQLGYSVDHCLNCLCQKVIVCKFSFEASSLGVALPMVAGLHVPPVGPRVCE